MLKLSEQNHHLNTVQIESGDMINRLEEKCKILSRENQDLKSEKSNLVIASRKQQDFTLTIEKLKFELQNEQSRSRDAEKRCLILEKRLDVQAKAECEAAALQALYYMWDDPPPPHWRGCESWLSVVGVSEDHIRKVAAAAAAAAV